MRNLIRVVTVVFLLAGAACAPGVSTASDTRRTEPDGNTVRVHVTNLYQGPIAVFAVGRGTSYKMGTVLPGFASQFTVRPVMIGQGTVEFVAETGNGDQPVRSGPLLLSPGKTVDFRIGTQLLNSSATIRP